MYIQEIFASRFTYYDVISYVTIFQCWVDKKKHCTEIVKLNDLINLPQRLSER